MLKSPDTKASFEKNFESRHWCLRARITGGFSLIELLVSVSVLMLLVAMLGQILSYSSNAWIAGESGKERLQNERAIADFIGAELQLALLPSNRASTTNLQFIVNPATVTLNTGDSVFWQAPLATDQTNGDLAEIGYFVKWDASDPKSPRANLCRFFVNASDTTNFLIYSNPANWVSDSSLESVSPATRAASYHGLFAQNVVGFWVECLDPSGNPITLDANGGSLSQRHFDSRRGYSYTAESKRIVKPACALPAAVNLSFVLLDSRNAKRLGPAEQAGLVALVNDAQNAEAFLDVAAANPALASLKSGLRIYQTTIHLRNSR